MNWINRRTRLLLMGILSVSAGISLIIDPTAPKYFLTILGIVWVVEGVLNFLDYYHEKYCD